jgi:hypothetical protein
MPQKKSLHMEIMRLPLSTTPLHTAYLNELAFENLPFCPGMLLATLLATG